MVSESGSTSHLVGFPATFPATFPAPSQPPYESVRTDFSTPPNVYGARDGRIHSGGVVKQMRFRNRSNLILLNALVNSSAAFSINGTVRDMGNSGFYLWSVCLGRGGGSGGRRE